MGRGVVEWLVVWQCQQKNHLMNAEIKYPQIGFSFSKTLVHSFATLTCLQCDLWPDGYIILNIWPFWTMKICPKYKIFAQQFCQILNSYCRSAGTFFEFYLSSEISTNLVTLRLLACLLERIKKLRIRWSHVLYFFLYKDQGSFQLKMSISKRKDFIGNVEISFENLPF